MRRSLLWGSCTMTDHSEACCRGLSTTGKLTHFVKYYHTADFNSHVYTKHTSFILSMAQFWQRLVKGRKLDLVHHNEDWIILHYVVVMQSLHSSTILLWVWRFHWICKVKVSRGKLLPSPVIVLILSTHVMCISTNETIRSQRIQLICTMIVDNIYLLNTSMSGIWYQVYSLPST